MEAGIRIGRYRAPIISKGLRENSVILVDIDGTLLPYVDEKFRHLYRCECGHEFTPARLNKAYPVSCPHCGGDSFKRNEPSLVEILSIVRKILKKNPFSYQRAQTCLRRLAKRHRNTNMRRAGVDWSVIMKITGHKTQSMFHRYNTVEPAEGKEAMRRMMEYLGEEEGGTASGLLQETKKGPAE